LVDGRKKESRMDVGNSFKGMEVSKDNVGSLEFLKKFTNLLRFGSTTFY
jgi:hypothetical protein